MLFDPNAIMRSYINIYQFLLCFDILYYMFSDTEKKEFLNCFLESVEVEQDDGRFLKRIKFRFPVFFHGEEVEELSLDNFSTLESVICMVKTDAAERNPAQ